jgi:hypothetical protein
MLYGYRESIRNQISTVVSAADTRVEYEEFTGKVTMPESQTNYSDWFLTSFLDHLQDDIFRQFRSSGSEPVLVFHHIDEASREAFIVEWDIKLVHSEVARDRQKDMIWRERQEKDHAVYLEEEAKALADGEYTPQGRSIEEKFGLDKDDPWDCRTEKEKESDKQIKEKMKKMRQKGELSGDSFGGASAQREGRAEERGDLPKKEKGQVHVQTINTTRNADGTVDIDNIVAIKHGGEVDTEAKAAKQAQVDEQLKALKEDRIVFGPEDFAAALRGDGSSDRLGIKGDAEGRKIGGKIQQPVFSPKAEAARKAYADEQAIINQQRVKEMRTEHDEESKAERDKGIFAGSDLIGEEQILVIELPEKMQESLTKLGNKEERLPLKNYPYNSEIDGRYLFPVDSMTKKEGVHIVAVDNLHLEKGRGGIVSAIVPAVMVVTKEDKEQPSWVIYRHTRIVQVSKRKTEVKQDLYVVKVR